MRRLIAITSENSVFREHRRIINMIRSGEYEYVHIRKPFFSKNQMREYLSVFPMDIREKLSLHSFQELATELSIGGVHLNKNLTTLPDSLKDKRISASCHSIEEFKQKEKICKYCFISPVFDSISKQGYTSKFTLNSLKTLFNEGVLNSKCVALGGITKENIPNLENVGFTSFAMLSSAWTLPKTMFITHQNENYSYMDSAFLSIENGIKFVQLRMKETKDENVVCLAEELRPICDKNNVLLTVDDRINLLSTGLFDGVHVGKNDMPLQEAKLITKEDYLLGATCNTVLDVQLAIGGKADYIGMGPYRFTTTKKNLAEILGLEGYKNVIEKIKPTIPLYAIGGIRLEDLMLLKQIGVYGAALSSIVLESNEPKRTIKEIIKIF